MCRILHLPSLANIAPCPPIFSGQSPRALSKAQRAGLAFQHRLAKSLAAICPPNAECHESGWFAFRDRNGPGCASPDVVVRPLADGSLLLVEAKLKLSPVALEEGLAQLQGLYAPLLRAAYPATPLRLLLVGKFLAAGSRAVPLAELRGRDLGEAPLVAFWSGGRVPPLLLNTD